MTQFRPILFGLVRFGSIRVDYGTIHQSFTFSGAGPADNPGVLAFKPSRSEKKFLEFLAPTQWQIVLIFEAAKARHFGGNRDQAVVALPSGCGFAILL